MMSSCVYYKFKSKKESSKIVFDGSSISIKELREKILLHSGLKANDMTLKIERPKDGSNSSKEEYKDDDIIKKFTTVIVSRMPCSKREQTRPKIANPEVLSKKDPYKTMSKEEDVKFHEMNKASKLYELDVSEDDKINLMMKQSTESYYLDRNPRNRGQPPGPPPATYVCHKCKMGGHYVNQCPGLKDKDGNPVDLKNLKRPTGIPQDFLVEVSKDTPGAYLTKDGRYALTAKDRDAYAQGKKEKRPFSEEENPAYIPSERKPVDMIVCQICHLVMRNAVFISCCGYSYCHECVTDYVFNPDVKGCGRCPNCNSTVESAEAFVPNPVVRDMVHKYNSGVTNLLSQSTPSGVPFKGDSGTSSSSQSAVVSPNKSPGKSNEPVPASNAPVPQSSPNAQPTSTQKGSEEDTSGKIKEKDTSAIRGPFVDGRRVLKPKPPPEVIMTRRSDTLKTEINPASKPSDDANKSSAAGAKISQPEVELDLGLDEVTDTFLNEKCDIEPKSVDSSTQDVKQSEEGSDESGKSTELPPVTEECDKEETPRAETPEVELAGGETISVHTFDRPYVREAPLRRERDWPSRSANSSGPSSAVGQLASVTLPQQLPVPERAGAVPPLLPCVRSQPTPAAVPPTAVVTAVPSAVPSATAAAVAAAAAAAAAPSAIGRPTNLTTPANAAFPQVYTGVNVYPCYPLPPAQGVSVNSAPTTQLYGYSEIPNPASLHPIVIPDPPILSEEQFNKLKRDLLKQEMFEEEKRSGHRRRPRGRSPGRPRSRSRSGSRSLHHRSGSRSPHRYISSSHRSRGPRGGGSLTYDVKRSRRGQSPRQTSHYRSRSDRNSVSPACRAGSASGQQESGSPHSAGHKSYDSKRYNKHGEHSNSLERDRPAHQSKSNRAWSPGEMNNKRSRSPDPSWSYKTKDMRSRSPKPTWSKDIRTRSPDPGWSYKAKDVKTRSPDPSWSYKDVRTRSPDPSWSHKSKDARSRTPEPSWSNKDTRPRSPDPSWYRKTARSRSPDPSWSDKNVRSRSPDPSWSYKSKDVRPRSPDPSWSYKSKDIRPRSPNPSWSRADVRSQSPDPSWSRTDVRSRSPDPSWSHKSKDIRSRSPDPSCSHTGARPRSPDPSWPHKSKDVRSRSPDPSWSRKSNDVRSRSPDPSWSRKSNDVRSRSPDLSWSHKSKDVRSRSPDPSWSHANVRSRSPDPQWCYNSRDSRSRSPGPSDSYKSKDIRSRGLDPLMSRKMKEKESQSPEPWVSHKTKDVRSRSPEPLLSHKPKNMKLSEQSRQSRHVGSEDVSRVESKLSSTQSSPNSYSSLPFDEPRPSRERRRLEGADAKPYAMKQSHSQCSLPSYHDKKMNAGYTSPSDNRSADRGDLSRKPERGSPKEKRPLATDRKKSKLQRHVDSERTDDVWYSQTSTFLRKIGVSGNRNEGIASPIVSSDSGRAPSSKKVRPPKYPKDVRKMLKSAPQAIEDHSDDDRRKIISKNVCKRMSETSSVEEERLHRKAAVKRKRRLVEGPQEPPTSSKQPVKKEKSSRVVVSENVEIKKKKKEKKEKKEKKKDKKKKKKKKKSKDDDAAASSSGNLRLRHVEVDGTPEGPPRDSGLESPSPLIPPPSKWELELDEHTNEFEEELRQEEKTRNMRIPSLISSINYRRVSVEDSSRKSGY